MIRELVENIKGGYLINKEEAMSLLKYDVEILLGYANEIREHFMGNHFDLCCIINGKSGKCSENCKFCAQSAYHNTKIDVYNLLSKDEFIKDAQYHHDKDVKRYSIVTSGKRLSKDDVSIVCEAYKKIREQVGIKTCASHGLLEYKELKKLKDAGVERYHNNLETSRNYFKNICTTHTYDEKIETIKAAQEAGLEVCSGGIIGLGENDEDRIDMAFELRGLNVKSIPMNVLNYIEGTPIGNTVPVTENEFLKILAIYRFINPDSYIRLAGGRNLLTEYGKRAFQGGANATITGDLLTTCGNGIVEDIRMIEELQFEI